MAVAPPLLQSRARLDSFPRGIVWHGTRVAVPKTTVLTHMKPQSHVKRVGRPVKQAVVPLFVLVLQSRRVKVRKYASFGNREGVIEVLIVSSFMRVPLVNQGRLLLHTQLAVIPKEKKVCQESQREELTQPRSLQESEELEIPETQRVGLQF